MADNNKSRFFYGYIIVLAAFLIMGLTYGLLSTFGVFFIPLSIEFGWTRAMTSSPASLIVIVIGLGGIIAGRLNDKFGPRLAAAGCGLFLGAGYLLMSQMGTIWHFYLFYGVMVGIGISGSYVPLLSTAGKWFVKKRGMMSGIISAGSGVGQLVMPLVASWLIFGYGWRTAFLVIGLASLVILVSAAQLLRRDPGRMGQLPDGGTVMEDDLVSKAKGFSLQQAIHTRQFWLLSGMFFLFGLCIFTIATHIYPHAVDLGISAATATNFLATIGGASIVGRVVMGSAGDRIGNKPTIIIDLTILSVALLWLQFANEVWMLYTFATVYGFAYGGIFPLISPMIAQLFGLDSHGVIFGATYFSNCVGASIGPVLIGYIFDISGGYQLGFIILAAASVIAILLTSAINTRKVNMIPVG